MRLHGIFLASLIVLAACATPAKTTFYTLLGNSPASVPQAAAVADYRVAIGPVTVPEAVDRRQIVVSVGPNREEILDAENWSAPLKREIPRVVAEVVGQRLPAARVAAHSQYGGQDADYAVPIDVLRFASVPGKSVTLDAVWSIRDRRNRLLHEARSSFVEQVNAPGIGPLVSAHGKALAALGEEIATAMRTLAQARTRPD